MERLMEPLLPLHLHPHHRLRQIPMCKTMLVSHSRSMPKVDRKLSRRSKGAMDNSNSTLIIITI
jgi:hypothetical protein